MRTLLDTPNACVLRDHPLGRLYIQAIDAYGHQMELSLSAGGFLHAYIHPGQRAIHQLLPAQAEAWVGRLSELATRYPDLLANEQTTAQGRNAGLVHLIYALALYRQTPAEVLRDL